VIKQTRGKGADVVILMDPRPLGLLHSRPVKRGGPVWQATYYGMPVIHTTVKGPRRGTHLIGPAAGYSEQSISFDPILLTMQTAWGSLGPRVPRWLVAVEVLQSGKITADEHVTHVFPLDKTTEVFKTAVDPHETIKVIIEP